MVGGDEESRKTRDYNKADSQIKDALNRLSDTFSTYTNSSELMSLNNHEVNRLFTVSNGLSRLLYQSKDMYSLLNGAWDPTIVPVSQSYGFKTVSTNANLNLVVGSTKLDFSK